jgi:CheY-like chemotaxis protein/two-component sensor histidine kinase
MSSETPDQKATLTQAEAEKLRAREDFFKLMSHEIRTPLNGVIGMLTLLNRTPLTAEQKSYLSTARESGDHLLTLVNDLLDYARIEAGHIGFEMSRVDLELLLQSVAELLSPRAHGGGIEIVWQLDPRLKSIEADEGRIRQILFNLAGNAIKFTKSGGVLIEVNLTDQGRIRFGVRDTGEGIPDEARARIFEAFGQVDPSHAKQYGGAGLGLVVVKKLVEAMKADLTLESEIGKGSHFCIEFSAPYSLEAPQDDSRVGEVFVLTSNPVLFESAKSHLRSFGANAKSIDNLALLEPRPRQTLLVDRKMFDDLAPAPNARSLILLAPEDRDEIDGWRALGWAGYLIKPLRRASVKERVKALCLDAKLETDTTEDERIHSASGQNLSVLLVEDNPVNALLATILLQREGCLVERAASGEEAISIITKHSFDMVFMDLGLPGLDGIGTTKQLRHAGVSTPIIALTANAFEEDRRACMAAGMNDFLTKPIEINALRHKLSQWCRIDTNLRRQG